ncbi:hypothetical protein [Puerhibacterium sp. TATVAM-FAB25]|uniref:hypothetical protein n=1 Tax=Puerhibacterium sp. TATVAM-FAB25 TaxID=3093699 RepID=UPI00397C1C1E
MSGGSIDGGELVSNDIVAYMSSTDLLHGFVRAFARACREGVPVQKLAGLSVFYAVADSARVAVSENPRDVLRGDAERARSRLERAVKRSVATEDEEIGKQLLREAERWRRAEQEALTKLAGLEQERADEQVPRSFRSSTQLIDAALARLATADDRFTQEEYEAFRTLVRDLKLVQRSDGGWEASAVVRLPVEDGVAEVGPIGWTITNANTGVQTMRARMDRPGYGATRSRDTLVEELTAAGVSRVAALVITHAPFPELAQLLREAVLDLPPAAWVGPEWRRPEFAAHIRAVYTDPAFRWDPRGKWTRMSAERQACVDLAIERGSITYKDLQEVSPGARQDSVWRLSSPPSRSFTPTGMREWSPVLDGRIERTRLVAAPRRCWCGALGTTIARVPEVATDLLCSNGHVVTGDRPSGPAIAFPSDYQLLRMLPEQWRAALSGGRAARNRTAPRVPTQFERTLLAALPEADGDPESASQLGSRLDRNQSQVLARLKAMVEVGWVRRMDGYPSRWTRAEGAPPPHDPKA